MKKKKTAKQIAALAAVVLLAAMYVVALFAAVFDSTASGILFRVCLAGTVVIPLFAWIYIWLYGRMTGRKTIADLNLMQDPEPPLDAGPEAAPEDSSDIDRVR